MTNQEAIEILRIYKQRLDEPCSNLLGNDKEAFDLAIKALLFYRISRKRRNIRGYGTYNPDVLSGYLRDYFSMRGEE